MERTRRENARRGSMARSPREASMKRFVAVILLVALAYGLQHFSQPGSARPDASTNDISPADVASDSALVAAIRDGRGGVLVTGEGRVARVLPDDDDGSRHQRFILEIASGDTLLVAHNIDLAPRIATLRVGDVVGFRGEYEPNERGGVIHWTHHDPAGGHEAGWLRHDGRTYQ
jgi:hypothetical protein